MRSHFPPHDPDAESNSGTLSPSEAYAEAQKQLARADQVWDSEPDERDWLPRYTALIQTADVWAKLAAVPKFNVGVGFDEEEDLRP